MFRLTQAAVRGRIRISHDAQLAAFSQWVRRNRERPALEDQNNDISNKQSSAQAKQGLTPENPFFIASPSAKCITGCSCSEDSATINWFYVTEGEPQTCTCGYFFKLVKVDPQKEFVPEYSRVMYVDDKKTDVRVIQKESFLKRLFPNRRKSPAMPASMDKKAVENKQAKT